MAIIETVTESMFHDAFERMGRAKQFSYDARAALFNELDSMGENIELDVIALCCEYTEYTHSEVRDAFDDAPREDPDDPDDEELIDWLRDRTTVIEFNRRNTGTNTVFPSVIVRTF